MPSGDEVMVSYSEEEIDSDTHEDSHSDASVENENREAIAAILEENEQLENETTSPQVKRLRSGKHRVSKTTDSPTLDVMKSIRFLEKELKSLKRASSNSSKTDHREKKQKIAEDNELAYDRPCSSKSTEPNTKRSQLSSANTIQLSSVSAKKQLSPVHVKKQHSSARIKQLSPVKQLPEETDHSDDDNEELELRPDEDGDPLAQEVQQNAAEQDDLESDAESSDNDDIFDDIVDAVNVGADDDLLIGEPVPDTWAEKLNTAWKTKIPKDHLTALQHKYKTPKNLTAFRIPKMNKEIWDLCSKWYKKADLTMSASQRALVKAVTAVLKINDYLANQERSVRTVAMQTTADIVSLLGKVNRDLSVRRKNATRPVLSVITKN